MAKEIQLSLLKDYERLYKIKSTGIILEEVFYSNINVHHFEKQISYWSSSEESHTLKIEDGGMRVDLKECFL